MFKKDDAIGFSPAELECNFQEVQKDVFFPATRYYGSKKRLLPWIASCLEGLKYNTVLDAFGGTATVSLLFKSLGKKIYYNDVLKSSRLQAIALLSNESVRDVARSVESFCASVRPRQGFISENFGGVFYTDLENSWLDGALHELYDNYVGVEFAEIFYCLQQACIQKRPFNLFHRKNLYLRENNDKSTKFGNWATWERTFTELMLRASADIQKSRYVSSQEPCVLSCTDAIELEVGYDLVYLDPPYIPTNRQDVSYLDRYHFLEGMADPVGWADKIDWSKPYRSFSKTEEIRRWNTKSTFRDNLFELVLKHKDSTVVLSYVDGAHPPLEEIEKFFEDNFRVAVVYKKPLSHALSSKIKTEVLFIGRS